VVEKIEQEINTFVNTTASTPVQKVETSNPFRLKAPAAGRFYSPLVLTIAREESISMADLEFIAGTGGDNRVTKKDILNYIAFMQGKLVDLPVVEQPEPVAETRTNHIDLEKHYVNKVEEIQTEEDKTLSITLEKTTGNLFSLDKPYAPKYKYEENTSDEPQEITATDIESKPAEPENKLPETVIADIKTSEVEPVEMEATAVKTETEEPEIEENTPEETPEPEKETQYFASEPTEPVTMPAVSVNGNVEIIEMDRMRKMIAQRMVDSKRIAPHVTSFVEADVTNIVFWRNRVKQQFKERENEAITFTPIFIEAIAKALKDYPMVNSSVDGDRIIVKKDINIGMAVALPNGNLIVPVIHNADQLNLVGITKKVNDLARRARENKLKLEDLEGGTYTMSNIGSFGNVMGTPIIMQPQVAIMSFGAVQKKPAVIETPFGDTLGIRQMLFLSHAYDHRIIDGALGGMFVRRVADYLEGFDVNRKVF
ncbi:MAG: 2-oxo acid dehydrogenase subunit E2, partial [Verrucomicrobia bacterium]|nr:2-oxo acid dehydrogenase subunit E2 [Cytophagales bacterium]